ncbi:MAG: hypothetical protein ABR875_00655 [Minisyncoccia bacterium]|jgi:hypothetical protein
MNIAGLSKAAVLAALYNASRPQGMGFLHYDPKPMTEKQAQQLLGNGHRAYFDYLQGRVMKIDLSKDEVDTWGYNRDNGTNAAENAIEALRRSSDPNAGDIQRAHQAGKMAAIKDVEEHIDEETTEEVSKGITTMRLGLKDMKDVLGPAVERVKR